MARQQMLHRAAHWTAARNRRDLDAVLRPFAEDARFVRQGRGVVGRTVLEREQAMPNRRRVGPDRAVSSAPATPPATSSGARRWCSTRPTSRGAA